MTRQLTGVRTATIVSLLLLVATAARSDNAVETIALIRHGEKPHQGLGQLNCQGLNRALALPQIIARRFGKPDFIFTPNPSDRKMDAGVAYDYVRPLATVEPTAISFGLPVDASLRISDIGTAACRSRTAYVPQRAHPCSLGAQNHRDHSWCTARQSRRFRGRRTPMA
jgi:hypothetical protein